MDKSLQAAAHLHHAWFTGTLLRSAVQIGSSRTAELNKALFRRQHLAAFLPGLEKLGLIGLPHAVACAQYHYLSNQIGGVRVEYMYESDRKAWVRYAPPRWVWSGVAICGVTSEISAAMLHGWHGHNGVTLGNPRLGFVCTKMTVDGQDGLEGYYYEYDRALAPEERVRFARGEEAPPFDPAKAPVLPSAVWPQARLDKALRNYCMEYNRSMMEVAVDQLGPDDALWLVGGAAKRIGMHFFDECRAMLGQSRAGAEGFAEFFCAMAAGEGDEAQWRREGEAIVITRKGLRALAGLCDRRAGFAMWNALWEGCLAAHDRFLAWSGVADGESSTYRITRRARN